MMSRLSIVMIAIAAFIASETAARAQEYGFPDPQQYVAEPQQYVAPGYAPGFAPQGYASQEYAQPAAAYAQPPVAYAQPPVAYPQVPPGVMPEVGQFGEFAGPMPEGVDAFSPVVDPPYPWRYWGSAEALLWWRHGGGVPVLFTTSPSPGTPRQINNIPNATVLGVPTTTVLFGGGQLENDPDFGVNLVAGGWFDELREVGFAARGFLLANSAFAFNAFSDPTAGGPDLGRPFFNTAIGRQDAFLIAFVGPNNPPGDPAVVTLSRGGVNASGSNQVWGAEAYFRVNWDRAPGYSIDIIGGYMFSKIDDQLTAGHDFFDIDPTNLIPDGTRFTAQDSFSAQNSFHGATMGLSAELQSARFTARMMGKVAFGDMHQEVTTAGNSVINLLGVDFPFASGFFNQAGVNSGTFVRDQFCVAPEANLTAGYQVTDNLNLSIGCNFIYWSRIALAGSQVNTNFAGAGVAQPFSFQNTDFWVLGMNFGINGRF
jgi:hypothetical protein